MELTMVNYVVCHKKRNAPRLSIRICEEKCECKNDCKEYLATIKMPVIQKDVSIPENAPAAPVTP
jgi:hypothetical protein